MQGKMLLTIVAIMASTGLFAQTGNLVGNIKAQEDGMAVPFASIQLFKDGKKGFETAADIDGKYKLEKIPCGIYTLKVKVVGYDSLTISDVTINENRKLTMNLEVTAKRTHIYEVKPIPPFVPKKQTPTYYPSFNLDFEDNQGRLVPIY
jgi:hypothetical protein